MYKIKLKMYFQNIWILFAITFRQQKIQSKNIYLGKYRQNLDIYLFLNILKHFPKQLIFVQFENYEWLYTKYVNILNAFDYLVTFYPNRLIKIYEFVIDWKWLKNIFECTQ